MTRQKYWMTACAAQAASASLMLALLALLPPSADARGFHGGRAFHGEQTLPNAQGASSTGGRRRGNDAYMKAASEERDKLLNTKLKSICRGC
jgi:hypothetical protein